MGSLKPLQCWGYEDWEWLYLDVGDNIRFSNKSSEALEPRFHGGHGVVRDWTLMCLENLPRILIRRKGSV